MARQKLEDIVSFLKVRLGTISDFDIVKYTHADTKSFAVKSYGAHIYIPETGPYEDVSRYIGKKLTEVWNLGLDIIINRPFREDESSITDSKGISYWKDTIENLLLHKTNSGVFLDTKWNLIVVDPSNDRVVLKGQFMCEIINNYD